MAERGGARTKLLVSFDTDLVQAMDDRCTALDISRSRYIRALVERDLDEGGDLVLKPPAGPVIYPAHSEPPAVAAEEYKRKKRKSSG